MGDASIDVGLALYSSGTKSTEGFILTVEDIKSTLIIMMGQLGRIDAKLDSKPDQGWIINLICIIFGLVLAAIAASAGIFALIR